MRYEIDFIRLVPHKGAAVVFKTIVIEAASLREAEARGSHLFRRSQSAAGKGRWLPHY